MVFDKGLDENQFGRAIVVPCRRPVRDTAGLVKEAECLWAAESNSDTLDHISAKSRWGCVALLTNRPIPDELRTGWIDRINRDRRYYGQEPDAYEKVWVDESGFLNISWPSSEDGSDLGVDALLATATNPTCDYYPSPREVAEAWDTRKGKKYIDYFCKNRAHGIKTFQDNKIEDRLRELWP